MKCEVLIDWLTLSVKKDDPSEVIREYLGLDPANAVNSRMRWKDIHESIDGVNKAGATVYIGAPSSEFRVRIYDKALEQGVDGHWIRVELVMRSANANAFVEDMANSENVGPMCILFP